MCARAPHHSCAVQRHFNSAELTRGRSQQTGQTSRRVPCAAWQSRSDAASPITARPHRHHPRHPGTTGCAVCLLQELPWCWSYRHLQGTPYGQPSLQTRCRWQNSRQRTAKHLREACVLPRARSRHPFPGTRAAARRRSVRPGVLALSRRLRAPQALSPRHLVRRR